MRMIMGEGEEEAMGKEKKEGKEKEFTLKKKKKADELRSSKDAIVGKREFKTNIPMRRWGEEEVSEFLQCVGLFRVQKVLIFNVSIFELSCSLPSSHLLRRLLSDFS